MHASVLTPVNPRTESPLRTKTLSYICLTALFLAVVSSALVAEPALRILKGDNQQTVYASSFAVPLTVQVVDSVAKHPMAGVQVIFTAASGIGLSASTAVSDRHGIATVSARALAAGVSSVSAQVAGDPASRIQFGNLAVNKAVLTVVPADIEATAGAELPAITAYAIRGFVNGDTEATARISGTPELSTTARDLSPRANYAIKGSAGTLSAANYTFAAGFGTLAILDAPETLSEITPAQEFGLTPGTSAKSVEIRAALTYQPVTVPAFLAGLRGESGVFVQTAIWQPQAAHPAVAPPNAVRNALAPDIAAEGPITAISVRPAVVSRPMLSYVASVPATTAVRSVVFVRPATPQPGLSSASVTAIRKAFNPPGTN